MADTISIAGLLTSTPFTDGDRDKYPMFIRIDTRKTEIPNGYTFFGYTSLGSPAWDVLCTRDRSRPK